MATAKLINGEEGNRRKRIALVFKRTHHHYFPYVLRHEASHTNCCSLLMIVVCDKHSTSPPPPDHDIFRSRSALRKDVGSSRPSLLWVIASNLAVSFLFEHCCDSLIPMSRPRWRLARLCAYIFDRTWFKLTSRLSSSVL